MSIKLLPTISIVQPVYNNVERVIEAIEKLKYQKYPKDKIDHVIINDGSTPEETKKLCQYLEHYNYKYQYIKNEKNQGISYSVNRALNIATGDYRVGLADDFWEPEFLIKSIRELERNPDAAAVYSNMKMCDEQGRLLRGSFFDKLKLDTNVLLHASRLKLFKLCIKNNFFPAPAMVFKRAVIDELGGYDSSLKFNDYDMNLRVLNKYNIIYLDEVLVTYRVGCGISSAKQDLSNEMFRVMDKHSNYNYAQKKALRYLAKAYKKNRRQALNLLVQSSLIKYQRGKRAKFIMKIGLNSEIVKILLKLC